MRLSKTLQGIILGITLIGAGYTIYKIKNPKENNTYLTETEQKPVEITFELARKNPKYRQKYLENILQEIKTKNNYLSTIDRLEYSEDTSIQNKTYEMKYGLMHTKKDPNTSEIIGYVLSTVFEGGLDNSGKIQPLTKSELLNLLDHESLHAVNIKTKFLPWPETRLDAREYLKSEEISEYEKITTTEEKDAYLRKNGIIAKMQEDFKFIALYNKVPEIIKDSQNEEVNQKLIMYTIEIIAFHHQIYQFTKHGDGITELYKTAIINQYNTIFEEAREYAERNGTQKQKFAMGVLTDILGPKRILAGYTRPCKDFIENKN